MTYLARPHLGNNLDLFGVVESPPIVPDIYPLAPGYQGAANGASYQAAAKIAGKAKSQSVAILALIKATPAGLTSDEIARWLDFPNIRDSRPRVAELHRQGEIIDSGERRRGESGLEITVWRVAPLTVGEGR